LNAPLDAMRSEGMQRAAWEPQFLAVAEQGDGIEGSLEAMRQLRELVTVLRLFKEGGVGLGAYAFAPTGEGKWRRLATGAAGTRPGGYKLSEAEAAELAELGRRLEAQPDPDGALRWAIARFEMGCERVTALEGLSDHLLALRGMLEGEGPVDATLSVRAAALVADPGEQEEARVRIERAFELERRLMTGAELAERKDAGTAIGLAVWIEDGLRALVREAALGALRENLAEAADEALILSGLEAGEAGAEQRGGTAEWDAVPESPEHAEAMEEGRPEETTRILEPAPETEDEIRITAWTRIAVSEGESTEDVEEDSDAVEPEPEPRQEHETEMSGRDWLSEVGRDATLEWPASKGERRPQDRERIDTPRVRHLFPVPDDADWEIGELDYDRRHKAGAR
jgi:hypothetical protein